ncbi:MAG: efflux RND transporter permease subunit, partial [Bacteroidota bacterium]
MNITQFSLRNYQFTLIMAVMAAVIGAVTLLTMPRAEDPQINPPTYIITVVYPGTSPEDMQQLIARPIEDQVSELDDINKLLATIEDGLAIIIAEFNYGVDNDNKYQEVVREVNGLRNELPDGIVRLTINKVDPSDVNILQVALLSETMAYAEMEDYADDLIEDLEQVALLKNLEVAGVAPQRVNIRLDLPRIAKYGIPLDAVIGNLQSEDVNIPGGVVMAGNKQYNIKSSGKFVDLEDIANTIVFTYDRSVIYLKDVAEVSFKSEGQTHITRLNGRRCILVNAALKDKSNIAQAQTQYLPILDAFAQTLPPNLRMETPFDQAENVEGRLAGLRFDFMLAIGLVLVTLLPLGIRASLVVMIA